MRDFFPQFIVPMSWCLDMVRCTFCHLLSTKQLHPQQGKDEDEEEEKEEETDDGAHGAEQGEDEVAEGGPVAGDFEDAQQPERTEGRDAERGVLVECGPHHFEDTAADNLINVRPQNR